MAAVLAVGSAAVGAITGAGGDEGGTRSDAAVPTATPEPPQLPRGGRSIFPRHRVVAYYGAPQSDELGALGIGPPDAAARRLERQAKAYDRRRRPALPAVELSTGIANPDAGEDGQHRTRQTHAGKRRHR